MKKLTSILSMLLLATSNAYAACVVTTSFQAADQNEAACFPILDEAKCTHYAKGVGVVVGVSQTDIDEAKKDGQKVVDYANKHVCEGKKNCGAYVLEIASVAKCDGKVDQTLPGGEYRGLTMEASRSIQKFANKVAEDYAFRAQKRAEKAGAKKVGRLWGND